MSSRNAITIKVFSHTIKVLFEHNHNMVIKAEFTRLKINFIRGKVDFCMVVTLLELFFTIYQCE